MKISYTWLKDFIDIDWSAERAAELLTALGLEVEGTERFESVKGGLKGVVAGNVVSCEKHPNADRLMLTNIDVGQSEPLQIVCGAPNIEKGQNVAVALVGTTLYDKEKGAWKIKESKIRGETSLGMVCAEDELGLGDTHEGILVLEEDIEPGTPLNEVFEVLEDEVFEIGLTPNRSDAMSHYGVARDLRAGLIQQGHNVLFKAPSTNSFQVDSHSRNIPVFVEDKELAPRYCGATLTDIKVKESPRWLKNRLRAIGQAPINNIVDATNYMMNALGQPFHAFDADKISGQRIKVKTLPQNTKFTTLDGVERTLDAEDLMICNEKKPMCIAGVFGGIESGVAENTTSIFLESAYFDPVSVRKTAKRHGLSTEASFRFERGIDPDFSEEALKRLVILIKEIAGGSVANDIDDFYPQKIEESQVFLRYEKIRTLVGQDIDQDVLKSILSSLQIRVNNVTESGMGLMVPPFRADVRREVDVIEEILRVYGYNNIEFNKGLKAAVAETYKFSDHKIQNLIGDQLIGQGFYEIMSNSLIDEAHVRSNKLLADYNIELLNPLSHDLAVLRQSLLPGGLKSIAYNLNRKNPDLRFFEFGKSYHKYAQKWEEQKHFCLFLTGRQQAENWNSTECPSGFFFLKGILDSVFKRLGLAINYKSRKDNLYSESLAIFYNKMDLGEFGVLKPKVCDQYNIDREVLFADLNWDLILEVLPERKDVKVEPIAPYPSVRRDFALLVDNGVSFNEIKEMAYQTGNRLLKDVGLFDVYQGDSLPAGKKSYAVSFTFLDEHKTLTDKKVDKIMAKFRKKFEEQLQAELR